MALIVEDGTGRSDAESYTSVADADTYHSDRGNSGWSGTDAAKEQALRKAADYIDGRYRFIGRRSKIDQAREWPRSDAEDDDGYLLSSTSVPSGVVDACSELALVALTTDLTPSLARGGGLKSIKVGPIRQEFFETSATTTIYQSADYKLSGLSLSSQALRRG